jgi:Ca-activated chloride channel homolog
MINILSSFTFYWPWVLVILPLPLILRQFLALKNRSLEQKNTQTILHHPSINRLSQTYHAPKTAGSNSTFILLLLWSLVWLMSVLCLAQPVWLERHSKMSGQGYDLMLAVDVSRSMLALDFEIEGKSVNRMAVVKGVVGEFIKQRKGDRLGLILFGETAYMQAPLTLDTVVVEKLLKNAVPRMAGDGTAIGDAIGLSVKKLKQRPVESRILILLTDGENTAGSIQPVDAAKMAKKFQIRIYTIGVGSHGDKKGEVNFPDKQGNITRQKMKIDEVLLKKIASLTDGHYFRATDTQVLKSIYQKINELEKSEIETESVLVPVTLYRWPLGAVLLLLLVISRQKFYAG